MILIFFNVQATVWRFCEQSICNLSWVCWTPSFTNTSLGCGLETKSFTMFLLGHIGHIPTSNNQQNISTHVVIFHYRHALRGPKWSRRVDQTPRGPRVWSQRFDLQMKLFKSSTSEQQLASLRSGFWIQQGLLIVVMKRCFRIQDSCLWSTIESIINQWEARKQMHWLQELSIFSRFLKSWVTLVPH